MATIKEKFEKLGESLFKVFESVDVAVMFSQPDERDPITGEITVPGEVLGPIGVKRPILKDSARLALGMAETEFLLIALQGQFGSFDIKAESTLATVEGVPCRVQSVGQDGASVTYRIRCKSGG